jgi:hypothetical protein
MLRIGIVHSGRIIEERLIRPGRAVTVGEHPRATVVVPRAELPERRFALFGTRGDGWELRFTPAMRGKLTVDGEVVSLSTLLQGGGAHRRRSAWSIPLDARTRGKVHVGEYTFLFQLVAPPPVPARDPRMAWGVRSSKPDVLFLATLVFSALVHVAGVVWLDAHPPPRTVQLSELPPTIVQYLLPADFVPQDTEAVPDEDATPLPVEVVDDPVAPSAAAEVPEPAETPPAERSREELEAELRARGYGVFLIPTTNSLAGGNPIIDLVGDPSALGDDVGRALAAGTVHIPRRAPEEGLRRIESGAGLAVLDADPRGVGGGSRGALVKERSGPAVSVAPMSVAAPPEVAASVSAILRPYRGRMKACYERQLKSMPDLAGKLTLSWIITPEGRVEDLTTEVNTTDSAELAACVRQVVSRITFSPGTSDTFVDGYPLLFSRN